LLSGCPPPGKDLFNDAGFVLARRADQVSDEIIELTDRDLDARVRYRVPSSAARKD